MRKRFLTRDAPAPPDWLDIQSSAEAEVTSEDANFPLESALAIHPGSGWRAGEAGTQTIRLRFDHPLSVRRIHLEFREEQHERTQEFVLSWSDYPGKTSRDILRQQFNFNSSATREIEHYSVQLDAVSILELRMTPDLSRPDALATLRRLQI
ncbi:MAG TPA: carbohydrate-binding protein, partial [Verrucomicrobiae bacterium]|nr:carbohydrate-binding protein [Verrucomicrobiae bacterium]